MNGDPTCAVCGELIHDDEHYDGDSFGRETSWHAHCCPTCNDIDEDEL